MSVEPQEPYDAYIRRRHTEEDTKMSAMHCCQNLKLENDCFIVSSGEFDFTVRIAYCKSCGSKKQIGSSISDGKK